MSTFADHYIYVEKRFYNKESNFKNFSNITEENISKINSLVSKFLSYNDNLKNIPNELYYRVLELLNSPKFNFELPSFDEKVLFLIKAIDPNCDMCKIYLSMDTKSQSILRSEIIKQIGFYNSFLIKYEKLYITKFSNELLTGINIDNTNYLFILASIIKNFNTSIERVNEIKGMAENWRNLPNINYRTCLFNLLNQSHILKLNSYEEQLIFFINCIDPNLNLLQIYEEECNISEIKKRSMEEFGFFVTNLFKLEKLYHDTYTPDTKVSDWVLKKRKN